MSTVHIRDAMPEDFDRIAVLLTGECLPVAGVVDHISTYLVAERDRRIVGAMGLEVYADAGLLRSAVVAADEKNKGIGGALYESLIKKAKALGIIRLFLLTNTAEEYFRRRGFKKIDQKTVTGLVTSSVEFSGACPSHAACMELSL